MIWEMFHIFISYLCIFFNEISLKIFDLSYAWVLCFYLMFKCYSSALVLYQKHHFLKHFLLVCDLASHSIATLFHRTDIFNLDGVQLAIYLFHGCAFGIICKIYHHTLRSLSQRSLKFFCMLFSRRYMVLQLGLWSILSLVLCWICVCVQINFCMWMSSYSITNLL